MSLAVFPEYTLTGFVANERIEKVAISRDSEPIVDLRWVLGANRTGKREVPDAPATTYAGRSLAARPNDGIHRALDGHE